MRRVDLPKALAVGADYGMTVLRGARPGAQQFADYLMSAAAQGRFRVFGFSAGVLDLADTVNVELPGGSVQSLSREQLLRLGSKTVSITLPGRGSFSFSVCPYSISCRLGVISLTNPSVAHI